MSKFQILKNYFQSHDELIIMKAYHTILKLRIDELDEKHEYSQEYFDVKKKFYEAESFYEEAILNLKLKKEALLSDFDNSLLIYLIELIDTEYSNDFPECLNIGIFTENSIEADEIIKLVTDCAYAHTTLAHLILTKYADEDVKAIADKKLSEISSDFSEDNHKSFKLVLKYGANPNILNIQGEIPLCGALKAEQYDVSRLLIHHGADINECSKNSKDTPLSISALRLDVEFIEYLLAKGASTNDFKNFKPKLDEINAENQALRENLNNMLNRNNEISVDESKYNRIVKLISDADAGKVHFLPGEYTKSSPFETQLEEKIIYSDFYKYDMLNETGLLAKQPIELL